MRVKFLKAVLIDGHFFDIGSHGEPKEHEVSEELSEHPHFKHFVKAGYIAEDLDAQAQPEETLLARAERLAERSLARTSVEAGSEEAQAEDEQEEKPRKKSRK